MDRKDRVRLTSAAAREIEQLRTIEAALEDLKVNMEAVKQAFANYDQTANQFLNRLVQTVRVMSELRGGPPRSGM